MAGRKRPELAWEWLVYPVLIFWALELFDVITPFSLDSFGIRPGDVVGLRGIAFAPFLHGDWEHVMANTIPFLVMGAMILLHRKSDFIWVTIIVAIIGGLGTWIVGDRGSVHIGASGVVFGYLGFLLAAGIFEKNRIMIARSLAVFMIYGGLLWGVLPQGPGISWEGHFFGLLGGVLAAWLLARK